MTSKFKSGLVYSVMGRYGNFLITLIVNIILSRILTPFEYGQVTTLQIFVTLFQMMSSAGVGIAIVQREGITENDIRSIYSFSIIASIGLALLFPIVGVGIDMFYGSHSYYSLSLIFSIAVFFYGMIVVPNAVLMKNLNFKLLNAIQIISIIFGSIVGVWGAYNHLGAYALVVMTITSTAIDFLLKAYVSKLRPGKLKIGSLLKIADFSLNIFISDSLKYFSQNVDNLLVGKVFGSSALGNYGKAYQLLRYPNYLISGVFVSVMGPVLASKKNDLEYLRMFYFNLLTILGYISFAITAYFFVNADFIINFLFGPQWTQAIGIFRILSLSVWVQTLFSIVGPMFEIRDNTHSWKQLTKLNTAIFVGLILVGTLFGNIHVLSAFVTMGFILTYMLAILFLSRDILKLKFLDCLSGLLKPFIFSLICAVLLWFNKVCTHQFTNYIIINLFVSGLIMVLLLIFFMFVTGDWKKVLKTLGRG